MKQDHRSRKRRSTARVGHEPSAETPEGSSFRPVGRASTRVHAAALAAVSLATVWRWRLLAPGPTLAEALVVGEALKAAATEVSDRLGFGLLPDDIYRDVDRNHGNAYWLPGDEDGDGLVDHAWVHAPRGLPCRFVATLALVDHVRVAGERFAITPDAMGPVHPQGPFGPARVWRAVTPYVTPRHRLAGTSSGKPGRERERWSPEAQLVDEITAPRRLAGETAPRGLPRPRAISWSAMTWLGDLAVDAARFTTERRLGGRPPADAVASFPTVTFPEPVMGPLAFGFGAHFGLGQLMPVEE